MEASISIKGLSVSYDRKTVLSNIYLDVFPGQLYGIIGPNGAGKSTLFKSILGLIDNNSGKIEIQGLPLKEQRKKLVYIPQRSEVDWQFPATVMDIVLMGRYPYKGIFQRLNSEDKKIAKEALEAMGIPDLKNRQIGELSGGQQQRVFLARAMCQQAEIFLFDEPFVGVDITTEDKIIQILKSLAEQGKTLMVIHHDLSKVEEYFDQVIMLNQRLIVAGSTKGTFTKENIAKTYSGQLPILHKANIG